MGHLKGFRESNRPAPGFGTFKLFMGLNILFILFFGTRPGKAKEAKLAGVPCPYCERVGTLNAWVQTRFIHLFWIPVYRLSSNAFVRCEHCKKAYEGDECTPRMQEALQKLKKE